jgi:hypothetical protein
VRIAGVVMEAPKLLPLVPDVKLMLTGMLVRDVRE